MFVTYFNISEFPVVLFLVSFANNQRDLLFPNENLFIPGKKGSEEKTDFIKTGVEFFYETIQY